MAIAQSIFKILRSYFLHRFVIARLLFKKGWYYVRFMCRATIPSSLLPCSLCVIIRPSKSYIILTCCAVKSKTSWHLLNFDFNIDFFRLLKIHKIDLSSLPMHWISSVHTYFFCIFYFTYLMCLTLNSLCICSERRYIDTEDRGILIKT